MKISSYEQWQKEWYDNNTECRACGDKLIDREFDFCGACEWEETEFDYGCEG